MRLSFKTRPQHSEWQPIVDFWREGDRIEAYWAGWTFDHLDPIFSKGPGPVFEGWTMLAALSGIVERVRLGAEVGVEVLELGRCPFADLLADVLGESLGSCGVVGAVSVG